MELKYKILRIVLTLRIADGRRVPASQQQQ